MQLFIESIATIDILQQNSSLCFCRNQVISLFILYERAATA